MHQARQARLRVVTSAGVVGLLTFSTITAAMVVLAPSATAADSSAVTVTAAEQDPDLANAPFPDLSVTVSQTKDLVSQGVRLTYTGGRQSTPPNNQIAGLDFLQVMQCWGDLKDANGALVLDKNGQPQPDRTTCQYGSTANPGQSRTSTKSSADLFAPEDAEYASPGAGWWDPPQVSIPFRAVNGKVLQRIADGKVVSEVDLDNNEFFTKYTTNEVPWVGFGASGAGTSTFEVQTNSQAPGLGCGNPVTSAGGKVVGQPCWLVVVPRGEKDRGSAFVDKSALLWENWEHRLAIRLDFKPLGVRCRIGAAERSLDGSELMTAAMASWQPKLCSGSGGSIYNLIVANEGDGLVAANSSTDPSMVLTSRALAPDAGTDGLTYAPVAVTGLTVAFAIDHQANVSSDVPASVRALDQQPLTTMNLTPRLVAKLLTNSYTASLPLSADKSHLKHNPIDITKDPDFLAVNDPEWAYQALSSPALADALVPLGRSDGAWAVWSYVMGDPSAVSFLAGTPDPWGMVVNPFSSTDAATNPTGVGASRPTTSYPKADPVEVDQAHTGTSASAVNLVTWRPYTPDYDTAGYWVLRGDGKMLGTWDSLSVPPKYSTTDRDRAGSQKVIGLTSTAAAAKYQVYTAALLNPAGRYVAPTAESMAAAAAVMTPVAGQPQVKALDYTSAAVKGAAGAYPLTVPVYAATNVAGGTSDSRAAYAAFIRYAALSGQTPGSDDGQLPAGYAPLPSSWAADAKKAADTIAAGPQPTPSPTPTPSPSPSATTTSGSIPVTRAPGSGDVPSTAPDAGQVPATGGGSIPVPTGTSAGPVVGAVTPDDPDISALRAAVPVGAAGGLVAALCVPLVPRIRRGA